ncbi:MAG: PQQ-binding-like beta-propeller repeat protein [Verrucomicrobiales bacterium]|nr:PQQ-binding-like beta-propeller repeat protein [Verrucomicrobiales bacterium]
MMLRRLILAGGTLPLALTLVLALASRAATSAPAPDWPNWRGPTFNGAAPEQSLPTQFSRTEGLAWSSPLPGPSAATPIVFGDRVFISSTDSAGGSLVALCLDRKTGRELWRHKVADGISRDERSNYASPSPLTDGKHVWFFYGQGDLAAYTLDGTKVWARNIQNDFGAFAFQWTFSSSPLLHDGRLYLQVLQRNVPVNGRGKTDGPIESFLLAMSPDTGKDLWRHVRPSDARAESQESYSTPLPFLHEGRPEILITGGDCISGHDPATGRELWRWGTWNPERISHWRLVPSAAFGGGVVLACGPKGSSIFAIKAGQSGTLAENGYAWKSAERELSSDVSTPLFYKGRFYVLNSDRRMLLAVEPATGNILWKGELPGRSKVEASPTAADGKIYVISMSGDAYVLGTGDKFEVLHSTPMGDESDRDIRASIAIARGQLFIRTGKTLFAVGPKN